MNNATGNKLILIVGKMKMDGTGQKQKYRVSWRVHTTGTAGHGKWFDGRSVVQDAVDRANKGYPDLRHWVETKNHE